MKPLDYSLENVRERVEKSVQHNRQYIEERLGQYTQRKRYQEKHNLPVLSFVGYGRSGKDTAAEYIVKRTKGKIIYGGSNSDVVSPLIAHSLGVSSKEAFDRRHENRNYWRVFLNVFREKHLTLISKMSLAMSDMLVGMRGAEEVPAVIEEKIATLVIWVEKPDVPVDETVEFTKQDCDLIILNDRTLEDYYVKLDRLLAAFKLI